MFPEKTARSLSRGEITAGNNRCPWPQAGEGDRDGDLFGAPASCQNRGADQEDTVLEPGKKAPAFKLPSDDGRTVSLSDFVGKNLIVYFYPRDNT